MAYPTSVMLSDEQHQRLRRLKARRGDRFTSDAIHDALNAGLDVLELHQDEVERQRQVHIEAVAGALVLGA